MENEEVGTGEVGTKECFSCGETYPATPRYFRRSGVHADGLSPNCKVCSKRSVAEFYDRTVNKKGVVGFRCVLWAEKCGYCVTVTKCWRLQDGAHWHGDERPIKLFTDPVFALPKKKIYRLEH